MQTNKQIQNGMNGLAPLHVRCYIFRFGSVFRSSVWLSSVHCMFMFNFDDIQSEYFFKHWHSGSPKPIQTVGTNKMLALYTVNGQIASSGFLLCVPTSKWAMTSTRSSSHNWKRWFKRLSLLVCLDNKILIRNSQGAPYVYRVFNFCLHSTVCTVHLIVYPIDVAVDADADADAVNIFIIKSNSTGDLTWLVSSCLANPSDCVMCSSSLTPIPPLYLSMANK